MEEMKYGNRDQAKGPVVDVIDAVFSPLGNMSIRTKKECDASVGFFLDHDDVLANYQATYKLKYRTRTNMLRIAYQFLVHRRKLYKAIDKGVNVYPMQVKIKMMQDDFVKYLTNMPGGNETW